MQLLESIPENQKLSTIERILGGFATDLINAIDHDAMPHMLCDGNKLFFTSDLDMNSISQGAFITAEAMEKIKDRYSVMLEKFVKEDFEKRIAGLMEISECAEQFAA